MDSERIEKNKYARMKRLCWGMEMIKEIIIIIFSLFLKLRIAFEQRFEEVFLLVGLVVTAVATKSLRS